MDEKPENERRTYESVWAILSNIDCSDYTEVKDMGRAKLTYLSWAWAWQQMMTYFPDLQVEWMSDEKGAFTGVRYMEDGSVMVHCFVRIPSIPNDHGSYTLDREMWLPVMDRQGKGAHNPDSRMISDTKMRCMVKAFALFGLGHYIYAGEDLPNDPMKERLIDTHIKTLKMHTLTLREELAGKLPAEVVEGGRVAINERDIDKLKSAIEDVQHRIARARQHKAGAQTDSMDPDDDGGSDEDQ